MNLKVAVFQIDIVWEDLGANIKQIENLLQKIDNTIDLVILPEMFLSGFSMDVNSIAIQMDSSFIVQLKKWAVEFNLAILGSLAIKEGDGFYNRACFFHPEGEIEFYDKRHLFRMGKEADCYTQGKNRTIIKYRGFNIMPLICYDLRFPVWSRNNNEYDILIYMANWPKSRQLVWDCLLKARAIENYCYVIGVNRIGSGGGIEYMGGSVAIDYKGSDLENIFNENDVMVYSFDKDLLMKFKKKFPVYKDSDKYEIF